MPSFSHQKECTDNLPDQTSSNRVPRLRFCVLYFYTPVLHCVILSEIPGHLAVFRASAVVCPRCGHAIQALGVSRDISRDIWLR